MLCLASEDDPLMVAMVKVVNTETALGGIKFS